MRDALDMTPEERQDYIEECIEVFKNSSGSAVYEAQFKLRLRKAGLDTGEIDFLVRTNRP